MNKTDSTPAAGAPSAPSPSAPPQPLQGGGNPPAGRAAALGREAAVDGPSRPASAIAVLKMLVRILRIGVSLPFLCLGILVTTVWLTVSISSSTFLKSEEIVPSGKLKAPPIPKGIISEIASGALSQVFPPTPPPEPPKEISPEDLKDLLVKPVPLTFYTSSPSAEPTPPAPPVSSRYLPLGTLIPCKLVNTIDSNTDGTPVVAVVIEDVCNLDQNGTSQIVIPAGTLAILDSTSPGRERDRIAADGTWVFVWRTRDSDNGLELAVSGRALSRSFDPISGLFGHDDGRAGLRGTVIENLGERRISAATHAAVQGGLSAAKQYDVTSNALTGQVIRSPIPTLRNALASGADAYLQEYADQLRRDAELDTSYVQVPAGTEFYVFPRTAIDLRDARRGSTTQADSSAPSQ